jgi:hypothetical protein
MPLALDVTLLGDEAYQRAVASLALPLAAPIYSAALEGNVKRTRVASRDDFLNGQALAVRTGELRASVRVSLRGLPRYAEVGTDHPGAGPLHFGWPAKNIRARPFLFPAIDAQLRRYPDDWHEAISRNIGRR